MYFMSHLLLNNKSSNLPIYLTFTVTMIWHLWQVRSWSYWSLPWAGQPQKKEQQSTLETLKLSSKLLYSNWMPLCQPTLLPVPWSFSLTHLGRVTHICVGKLSIIGSDNGLLPEPRQAIIWTNAGILLIGPLGTNFNEILIEILTFLFKKIHLKLSSGK